MWHERCKSIRITCLYIIFMTLKFIKRALIIGLSAIYVTACGGSNTNGDHDHESDAQGAEAHEGHEGHDHSQDHKGHEGHDHGPHDHDHDHDHNVADEESLAAHTEGEGDEIILSPSMAERFGVKTEKVEAKPFAAAVKVSGLIEESPEGNAVVVAPVAGTISFASGISEGRDVKAGQAVASINPSAVAGGNPNAAAKAALDLAKAEVDRLKPLYEENLVTASTYNEAVRNYNEAKAAYSAGASGTRCVTPKGGMITQLLVANGQYVQPGEAIATVSNSRQLVLRGDLPTRKASMLNGITDASFRTQTTNDIKKVSSMGGKRSGSAGMSNTRASSPGYVPVYFTINNDGSLLAGTPAEVWLLTSDEKDAITVPVTALAEQQGDLFVFIKVDEEGYMKLPVKTGVSDGNRIEILSGLTPGMEVVTEGVTTVKIAGNSGAIPAHSHSH